MIILTLMLVDVELNESENWNSIMYGTIEKHPLQSLYTLCYVLCDYIMYVQVHDLFS